MDGCSPSAAVVIGVLVVIEFDTPLRTLHRPEGSMFLGRSVEIKVVPLTGALDDRLAYCGLS